MEAFEMIGDPDAEIRNTQDLATLVSEALMDIASGADLELDLCYTPGELSRPDGGITLSTMLDSTTGSFSLIEDRQGDMWLVCWARGKEAGHVRRIELGDNLDELVEFCIGHM